MSRFRSLAHSIWHCHYHIVWVPKYRFRILKGEVRVEKAIRLVSDKKGCIVIELNIQKDHVHLLVMIPSKLSISGYVGIVKGKRILR